MGVSIRSNRISYADHLFIDNLESERSIKLSQCVATVIVSLTSHGCRAS